MESLRCLGGHILCPWVRLYFYEQVPGSGDYHLIVKPECMEMLVGSSSLTLVTPETAKKSRWAVRKILCPTCERKVGTESPVGPNEELLFCFDFKNVKLHDSHPPSKWKSVRKCFLKIETWTGHSVFQSTWYDQKPFVAPRPADFQKLDIASLTQTTPRNYQIELFVRAAMENSLIFLPTGTGKTLVAVMLLKFLKQLNEGKVGIFLAHRIPLVHQQARVLEEEGNLRVKVITGENSHSTANSADVDKLCSDFEVLVLTAQIFLNLLLKGFQAERCYCIVFDEAHHAVGDHAYAKILRELSLRPLESRPRVLGLTASPAGEATFEATHSKVEELCHIYCSASVLMPVLWAEELQTTSLEAETEYSYVCLTPGEVQLENDLCEYFYLQWDKLYARLSEATRVQSGYHKDICTSSPTKHRRGSTWTSFHRKRLQDLSLRFCSDEERSDSRDLMERMFEILVLIDVSRVHGVSTVKKQLMLKSWGSQEVLEGRLLQKLRTLSNSDGSSEIASSRVEMLVKEVRSAVADNPASRILVFVETRYTARALEHLLSQFPDMEKLRPSRLVGHCGFDGMSWEEQQKPMLERFRSGFVQLLIATSVLEEGIDVPTCNLVIRFDGMKTLIGNVQSRGRARLKGSKFIVLLNVDEREKAQKLRRMEADMLEVVRRKFSLLSMSTTSAVNYLIDQKDSVCRASATLSSCNIEEEGVEEAGEDGGQSFVVKLKFHTRWLTEGILRATLRKYADVLKFDMKCSLLYLGSFPEKDASSTYREICAKAIPQLLEQAAGEHLWFQRCSTEISTPVDDDFGGSKKLQLSGFFAGIFKDPSTFLQVYCPQLGDHQHSRAKLSEGPSICWNSQSEFLSVHIPQEAVILEFTPAAIDGWILFHHDAEYTTHRLYVPLRQAPQVYSPSAISQDKRLGADVCNGNRPNASLLNIMSDCRVFELVVTAKDKNGEDILKELVENLESHGVLVYDTKVEDIFSFDDPDIIEHVGNYDEGVQPAVRDSVGDGNPVRLLGHGLLARVMLREHRTPELEVQKRTHFKTSFILECIFSQYACKFPRILVPERFYEVLYSCDQLVQERSLQAMVGSIAWFSDPLKLLEQATLTVLPSVKAAHPTPTNYVPVLQATVTPCRVIFYEPLMMKSSRLLRHFDPENFLKVSFRDENLGFMPGNESELMRRVYGILQEGVRVAGRLYVFLGCSSSMLRSHTCWMTCLNPSEVRSWLGDFHEIRCVGKYMARVGMGMAASDETITVEDRVVDNPISDIMRYNFCFSDGVGKISCLSLERVLKYLHPKENRRFNAITAIQIRVAGYKGVVALDPTLPSHEMQCQLRKSMRKFHSNHRKLEVLNAAISHPVYLNRQGIVLLSCLGVEDSTFEWLQEQQLQELLKIFLDDQSEKSITRNCPGLKLQSVLQAGIHIPSEPFFQHILSAIYFQKVQRLVTKTHIFVPDGRLLMGVLDETNSLNYGEIFVQISDKSTDWEPRIISGTCMTYKNPCFHPGDIRVLEARDMESLRHLVNCVVFPAKGPRPHPDEMSGSDLDGDMYTVIWMPDLIPVRTHEPMSYEPEPPLEVPEVKVSDMLDFFVKTMGSAELGLIANSHLALADSKSRCAVDKDCIELAKLHARAVDFPKTGQQVSVRKDLIPSKYPDFMEKPNRTSYPSQKVLGRLYRRAKCLFGDDMKRHVNVRLKPDNSLLVEGYTDYIDEARETYKQYRASLRGLMQCYGVKQEAEIVTGCIVTMFDHFSSGISQWSEVVKQQFKELVQTFRGRFFASTVSSPELNYKLASAWYMAAYTDDDEETRSLSFPWLVSDILAVIKHNRLGEGVVLGAKHGQSLEESVYHSMRADFIEQHPAKFASLLDRRDLLEKVETCVRAVFKDACVKMFGSSSTYLFEPGVSDVDLCVKIPHMESNVRGSSKAQIDLLDDILPCLQQDFPGTVAIRGARVPILKNDSGSLAFDLTADDGGLRKSEMVLKYISLHPSLLLALAVVVKWGRNVGLIASQSRGQFTAFSITWLLIQFCLEQGYLQSIDFKQEGNTRSSSSSSSSALDSAIEEVLDPVPNAQKRFVGGELPSEILLNFFQYYADLSVSSHAGAPSMCPLRIADPLGESNYSLVDLDTNSCTLFGNRCLQALHALTRTRTVKSLYVLGERHVCLRLSRFQSALFRGAEEFHAKRLSSRAGGKARVRIFCQGKRTDNNSSHHHHSRNRVLHVDIQGDPAAVQIVEEELQELNSGHCWLPAGRQASYVKGATFLLFEGSLSDQDRVGFVSYSGQCHLKHVSSRLHVPLLLAKVGGSTWLTNALSKLRTSVWRQRQYLLTNSSVTALPVHALIRFGTLYITNVPFDLANKQSIRSVSVAELEEYVVRGKKQMKPGNMSEHGEGHQRSEPAAGRRRSDSIAASSDDELDSDDDSADTFAEESPFGHSYNNVRRRKKVKSQQPGASQSLFPHVHGSLESLLTMLRIEGFRREDREDPGKYLVTLYLPKERQVRLNADLEFISLSLRPVRWLCGSLLFDNEEPKPQLQSRGKQQQQEQRPNCVRFNIRTHRQIMDESELRCKVKQNPLLEHTRSSGQGIRVGPAFHGQVGYVRWVKKEIWVNDTQGLMVKIMKVTEWQGWNKNTNSFKSHKSRHEVELHMLDTDAHLRGSDLSCEQFIRRFWNGALKFKAAIL